MRLDAVFFVMPDRTDAQIGFVNAEGRFGFAQLNVGLPKLFIGPILDIGAQDVSPFAQPGPIIPLGALAPLKFYLGGHAAVFSERNRVAPCGPI